MKSEPLSLAEQEKVKELYLEGGKVLDISKEIGRSPAVVRRFLKSRETEGELADRFETLAKKTLDALDEKNMKNSNILQSATAAGIFVDKMLLLRGRLPSVDVRIYIALLEAIRERRDAAEKESSGGELLK